MIGQNNNNGLEVWIWDDTDMRESEMHLQVCIIWSGFPKYFEIFSDVLGIKLFKNEMGP